MNLAEHQAAVIRELATRGITGQGWYSGGGISGILIVTEHGNRLFTTLETPRSPGEPAWLGFDYDDNDGNLIASIEVEATPLGARGEATPPAEMANAIARLYAALA